MERRIEFEELYKDPEISDEELIRAARAKASWKDWAMYEYLTYWVVLGACLLNMIIVSEIIYIFRVRSVVGGLAVLLILITLFVLEWFLYDKYRPKSDLFRKRRF